MKSNVRLEIGKFVLFYIVGKTLDYFWGLNVLSKSLLVGISMFYLPRLIKLIKIREKLIKLWEYLMTITSNIKHWFIEKEILLFQSQEDKNLSWFAEIYIDKKTGFCSMCQGGEILNRDKIKKILCLTLRVLKIKLGNKTREENIVNTFCRDCSKKKIEDLRNNLTLKNPERLKNIDRELN